MYDYEKVPRKKVKMLNKMASDELSKISKGTKLMRQMKKSSGYMTKTSGKKSGMKSKR